MVILNSSESKNEEVLNIINKLIHENNFKYLNFENEGRHLVCNNGSHLLRRKVAHNAKLNVPTKCVFVHAYDPNYLFEEVIKSSLIDFIKEYQSIDIYIISNSSSENIHPSSSVLMSDNCSIYLLSSEAELEQRIHADRGERKIVLNFEPNCRYVRSDIFIYLCFLVSNEEMKTMFRSPPNEAVSKYLIIDTMVQSCPSDITFMGSNANNLVLQKCLTFYTLKNCPIMGKRVFQLVHDLIFAAVDEIEEDHPNTYDRFDDNDDNIELQEDEEIDKKIQETINASVVCFIDYLEQQQSYMANFIKLYLGNVNHIYNVESAWWALSRCPVEQIKIVIFAYTRSVPNFNLITAFVNAWKHLNRSNNNNLICILLVSPVINLSSKEALSNYHQKFQWLLNMASSINCCEGMHCEQILKKQYMIESMCPNSVNLDHMSVTELILKIFQDIESFVKAKENSQNPIFHEREILSALSQYDTTLTESIIASYLYRGIPLIGKDGIQKVCTRICDKNLFVVKNDFQKYVNLATMTGIDFDNTVSALLNELREEYSIS